MPAPTVPTLPDFPWDSLAGDRSLDPGEPKSKLRGSFPKEPPATPTATFVPGDRIGSLEVVAAPGHTPGQVAFLDTRDRTLLCGDAYSTIGGVATTAVAEMIRVAFDEWNLHRIEAGTLVHNHASRRVLAKNGFTEIGLAPGYLKIAGRWQDHILHQRLNERLM